MLEGRRGGGVGLPAIIVALLIWGLPVISLFVARAPASFKASVLGGVLLALGLTAVARSLTPTGRSERIVALALLLFVAQAAFLLWTRFPHPPEVEGLFLGFSPWSRMLAARGPEAGASPAGSPIAALVQMALWIAANLPSRPQSNHPRLDWAGRYQAVVFGLACVTHVLALTSLIAPGPRAAAVAALPVLVFVLAFIGFFLVKRRRVARIFEPRDPKVVRRIGTALGIWCAACFLGGLVSSALLDSVVKTREGYAVEDSPAGKPATELQYRRQGLRVAVGGSAFLMLFTGFSLLDRLRHLGILPRWDSEPPETGEADAPPEPVETTPPATFSNLDVGEELQLRLGLKSRVGTFVIAACMLTLPATFLWAAASAPSGIGGIALVPAAIGIGYMSLVLLFFALYPGPIARVSPRGLWLVETGWLPWPDLELLEVVGTDVHIHLKPGAAAIPPWPFRPWRAVHSLIAGAAAGHARSEGTEASPRRFAALEARDISVDADVWLRYAAERHGVKVQPRPAGMSRER